MRGYILILFAWFGTISSGTASTVLAKGLFSYEAPAGWSVGPRSNSPYDVAQTGKSQSDYGAILVSIRESNLSLHDFIEDDLHRPEAGQKTLTSSRQPFLTAALLDGFRIVFWSPLLAGADDAPTTRVRYYFDGGSNQKIVIEGSCPASRASHYLPLFDAAMKTFTLE